MPKILYLSYDGLTDNLGQSQILPYINGLAALGHNVVVISVDKPDVYAQRKETVLSSLGAGVKWYSLAYHRSPPLLSTLYDLRQMRTLALELVTQHDIDIVHVRSYPPMQVALSIKAKQKVKVLFDMRGFYPEERLEGGIWSLRNPIHRLVFQALKRQEDKYFRQCDHIVTLTKASKEYLVNKNVAEADRITVIPCCADFDHFKVKQISTEKGELRVLYLGSLGTWYSIPEMLDLFVKIKELRPDAELHIVTGDQTDELMPMLIERNISQCTSAYSAEREEVPDIIRSCDLSIFLIKESFSKKASSPTKLAEILACGVPVICNSKVGDLESIGAAHPAVHSRPEEVLASTVTEKVLSDLLALSPIDIRARAETDFSLAQGVLRYAGIYRSLKQAIFDS